MTIKNKFVFTKNLLQKLPVPNINQKKQIYYDSYQPGLALVITYGATRAFYLYKTIKHKAYIKKIGQFPYMTVEEARTTVYNIIKDILDGKQPFSSNAAQKSDISLSDFFFNEYLPKHANIYNLKDTAYKKEQVFNHHFTKFRNKQLSEITRQDVESYHKFIGSKQKPSAANHFLGLMTHIYNIAIEMGYIDKNPAIKIKPFPTKSRDRFLQPTEISDFMNALNSMNNDKLKDYVLLLLLTGQRRGNIESLRWSHIDFHNNIMYLPHTKNGDSQHIPLTEQAVILLKSIKDKQNQAKADWIFPSTKSKSGHIEGADVFWQQLLKSAGLKDLHLHDLRRTMASYQAILGSSMNIIGKSLGHKSMQSTAVYARLNLSPVRDSMQKATNEIFKLSEK